MNDNSLAKYTGSTAEGIQQITDILVEQGGNLPESLEMLGMKHSFTDGIYAREMTIPKDTMVVGKIHKHRHHNFLLKGEILVATAEQGTAFKGPYDDCFRTRNTKSRLCLNGDCVDVYTQERR